jgi:hypothetical protein
VAAALEGYDTGADVMLTPAILTIALINHATVFWVASCLALRQGASPQANS